MDQVDNRSNKKQLLTARNSTWDPISRDVLCSGHGTGNTDRLHPEGFCCLSMSEREQDWLGKVGILWLIGSLPAARAPSLLQHIPPPLPQSTHCHSTCCHIHCCLERAAVPDWIDLLHSILIVVVVELAECSMLLLELSLAHWKSFPQSMLHSTLSHLLEVLSQTILAVSHSMLHIH